MDALRDSVKAEGGRASTRSAKKGRKKVEGQREMLFPIAGKKGKEAAPVKRTAPRPHARRKRAG
jgi:DNA end-binding protein Ku